MLRRYVLTGAPGAGKTVVGLALEERGYALVAEAATDVIAVEQARGVDQPWQREGFIEKIVWLQRQRQNESGQSTREVQIYDRSPLCTLALARYLQRPVPPMLAVEVHRMIEEQVYERDVFLLRPLGFIAPTPARRVSYEDSLRFKAVHEAVYREHDFNLVDVPPGAVDMRTAIIDRYINPSTPYGGGRG